MLGVTSMFFSVLSVLVMKNRGRVWVFALVLPIFFALPFGPGSLILFSSSLAHFPLFSGFFLWVLLEFFL